MSSEGSNEDSLGKNRLSNQHHAPLPQFFMYKLGTMRRVPVRPCSVAWKFTDGGKIVSRDTVILLCEQQEEKRNK